MLQISSVCNATHTTVSCDTKLLQMADRRQTTKVHVPPPHTHTHTHTRAHTHTYDARTHARARARTHTVTVTSRNFIMFLNLGKAICAVRVGYHMTAAVAIPTIIKLFSHFI